jgi:dTDP-4-amino-4,6-dideoxygalactose transaminase
MAGPGSYLIGREEADEVLDVLSKGHLLRYGDERDPHFKHKVWSFERAFEQQLAVPHALAVNSGTSALLTGLAALGIGPGDEVIAPGYCYMATLSCIVYAGAVPVLAEIDETLTLDPADVRKKITPRTRAIMPVHMLGCPSRMDALQEIAQQYGLALIEDACQACGGSFAGTRLGTIGDVGAFSLNFDKIITAGDGGVLTTRNPQLYERAFAFHDQGFIPAGKAISTDRSEMFGLTLRMNELTGAVALAQLRKLDAIIETMRRSKAKLLAALPSFQGMRVKSSPDPEGECGSIVTLQFADPARAAAVAEALGTMTLERTGWHVYSNMGPLLARRLPARVACPFDCGIYPHEVRYQPGQLPRTDELLRRSVNLSVGVVDPFVGTAFGINILSDDDEIAATAGEFERRVRPILS